MTLLSLIYRARHPTMLCQESTYLRVTIVTIVCGLLRNLDIDLRKHMGERNNTYQEIRMAFSILVAQRTLLKSWKKKNVNSPESTMRVTPAKQWILYFDEVNPEQLVMMIRTALRSSRYPVQRIHLPIIVRKLKANRGKGWSNGPITKICSFRKFKLTIVKMRRPLCKQKRCSSSNSKSRSSTLSKQPSLKSLKADKARKYKRMYKETKAKFLDVSRELSELEEENKDLTKSQAWLSA